MGIPCFRRRFMRRQQYLLAFSICFCCGIYFIAITPDDDLKTDSNKLHSKIKTFSEKVKNGALEIQKNIVSKLKFSDSPNSRQLVAMKPGHVSPSIKNYKEKEPNRDHVLVLPPSAKTEPGELGEPVILGELTPEETIKEEKGWEDNAYSLYVSDMISVNRSLKDPRPPECKAITYQSKLPSTSVILCFHNEGWSVLQRSVMSIINRSPPHLLKEIILVDDFSDTERLPDLKYPLEKFAKSLGKVRIVRALKREGLIRARLLGADAATAEVLTFLDSHIECTEGWLEPLLDRIASNSTNVVCPCIDVIDTKTFKYYSGKGVSIGGFGWNLIFNWHTVPEYEEKRRKHTWLPVRSPTMAGGLFAIDKVFFEKLGRYDPEFDIWGGENMELSFKTWTCGGTLEIVPCSHVGHVFRSKSPYKWKKGVNVVKKNSVRVAEVWMDEYKEYFYETINYKLGDYGDVSERKELRRKLNCKSFDWYMKNIYPEAFIPGDSVAKGEIRNHGYDKKYCLDSGLTEKNKDVIGYPCHKQGGNQMWMFTRDGELRRDDFCLDYPPGKTVSSYGCHGLKGHQWWNYDPKTHLIVHKLTNKCLQMNIDRKIEVASCWVELDHQKWTFENYNASKLIKSHSVPQ